jgi:magnesium transporter
MQTAKFLSRKKSNPKDFIYTGSVKDQKTDQQLFEYGPSDCIVKSGKQASDLQPFNNEKINYWLNLHGLHDVEKVVEICNTYQINDLIIQDILDVNQRPKYVEYKDYTFFTLKSMSPSDDLFLTEQISFVFGDNFLISFQERKADFFKHIRSRLIDDRGLVRHKKVDFLLYLMLESILDNFFKSLENIQHQVDEYNLLHHEANLNQNILITIEEQKRVVSFIKKSILPIKEFSIKVEGNLFKHIEKDKLKYYLEIKDLCLTLLDNSDMVLAALQSQTNLFFSLQGFRMNQVMKTLTIISSIFIPLTFVAGIYGMNFTNMPELEWQNGYYMILGLFLAIAIVMIIYFKKKKWF